MRHPRPVPPHLADRAFSRREAIEAGITSRQLQHPRFVQVFPGVFRLHHVELDPVGLIEAARLTLPSDARVSHQTRLRLLGLEIGPQEPLHFTVARDLHLDLDGITLHRTVAMPSTDAEGVSIAAAFIGVASLLRPIEVIAAGDWLLHRRLLDPGAVTTLAMREPWQPGGSAALDALPLMNGNAESVPESQTRCILVAAGLPVPEVNVSVTDAGVFLGRGDLVYRRWRLVIEYEGRHHALDARQFAHDIDRYAGFRHGDWAYLQVTAHQLARPREMCAKAYEALVKQGYDGDPPRFGELYRWLFAPPPPLGHCRAVAQQPHSA